MGDDYVVHMAGVIQNLPGSDDQALHRDSAHLFESQMPAHAFVIFVPLVPMVESNGATHFKPGSHKWACKADGQATPFPSLPHCSAFTLHHLCQPAHWLLSVF